MKIVVFFQFIMIIILSYLLFNKTDKIVNVDVVKIDTLYTEITNTKTKKLTVYKTDTVRLEGDTIFIPSEVKEELKEQFNNLALQFSNRHIYEDTLLIDSIGYVCINDTVQYNLLQNRTFTYNYKIPTIKETIIKPQLYYGFQVNFNFLSGGISYQKKNNIYGLYFNSNSTLTFLFNHKL